MFSDSTIRDDEMDVDASRLADTSKSSSSYPTGQGSSAQPEEKPFTVTILSSEDPLKKSISACFKPYEMLSRNTVSTVIISSPIVKEEEEEDVSEAFVTNCNEHIGNEGNLQKAWRLLKKMRMLGGLEPTEEQIDISASRKGLCILTALDHHKLKIAALDSLVELLERDDASDESGEDIVKLGISLIERMNRNLMQTEKVQTQKKFARAYNSVAELIQREYGRKNIGGITEELRTELIKTARKLEDLNTHEDPELHFIVESALEGVKRLKDDRKELFELLERTYHLIMAGLSLYFDGDFALPEQLEKAFIGIDPRFQHAWYDGVFVINALAKKAVDDFTALKSMQALIKSKYDKLDWKFLFGAINQFEWLAIHGATLSIQQSALKGHKKMEEELPGIDFFVNCHHFDKKPDMKPLIHFCAPKLKDPNILIREACVRSLFNVIAQSQDSKIRFHAKMTVLERLKVEEDMQVHETILSGLPKSITQKYRHNTLQGQSAEFPHVATDLTKRSISSIPSSSDQTLRDWLDEVGEFSYKPLPANLGQTISPSQPGQVRKVASGILSPYLENQEIIPRIMISSSPTNHPSPSPVRPLPIRKRQPSPRQHTRIVKRLAEILGSDPDHLQGKIKTRTGILLAGENQIQITEKGIKEFFAILRSDASIHTLDLTRIQIPLEGIYVIANGIKSTKIAHIILSDHETKETVKALAAALQVSHTLLLSTNCSKVYLLLGGALLSKKDAAESINYLSKGIQLEENTPKDMNIHVQLLIKRGRAKLLNDNKIGAFNDFSKAVEIAPDNFKGAFEIAKFYLDQNDLVHAKTWGETALKINPSNAKARYLISLCESVKS
jgi:hypothetical protein